MHEQSLRPDQVRAVQIRDVLLAAGVDAAALDPELLVTGVAMSGLSARPGDLYLAVPGATRHGAEFAAQAAAAGAVAVLTDEAGARLARDAGLPVVVMDEDPRSVAGAVAAAVYRTDTAHPTTFGVTGTNGKTSTAHILDALLRRLGHRTGVSSTAQRRIGDVSIASGLTTPEAPEVHAILARMLEHGVDDVIFEVSAHALTRHRVDAVRFDVAAFTNLSHDHLDDYADMDEYLRAKQELFTTGRAARAVVSLDSQAGRRVADDCDVPVTTIASTPDTGARWLVTVEAERRDGTTLTLADTAVSGRELRVDVTLLGRHMAANTGLAMLMLLESGIELADLERAVAGGLHVEVPGRIVRVSGDAGPAAFVDAGHTPDAIAHTLDAIRAVTPGRVIAVIGADGGRDSTKRGPIGAEAAARADVVVVTDHHPRTEDPAEIRRAVLAGAAGAAAEVEEVADPAAAIRRAAALAGEDDAILWSGLASQDYRAVGTTEVPFSALEETRRALAEAGWPTSA